MVAQELVTAQRSPPATAPPLPSSVRYGAGLPGASAAAATTTAASTVTSAPGLGSAPAGSGGFALGHGATESGDAARGTGRGALGVVDGTSATAAATGLMVGSSGSGSGSSSSSSFTDVHPPSSFSSLRSPLPHPQSASYSPPVHRSVLFGLSTERGHLWVHDGRGGNPGGAGGWGAGRGGAGAEDEAGNGVPFRSLRDAPLGVLVATDPMLTRPLRLALHGLLMRLLVDQEFKRDFAIAFARLYEVCVWSVPGGNVGPVGGGDDCRSLFTMLVVCDLYVSE